jgi:hypothetical protein
VPVGQAAFVNEMASGTKRGHADTGERGWPLKKRAILVLIKMN